MRLLTEVNINLQLALRALAANELDAAKIYTEAALLVTKSEDDERKDLIRVGAYAKERFKLPPVFDVKAVPFDTPRTIKNPCLNNARPERGMGGQSN